uniref:HMG box domain-containing protein n=1 Tax=Photinus pyralis TaxID=7054 RepID=A0A1Y1MAT9_PHOPY
MDLISKNKPFHKENFFTMDTAPIVSLFNMGTQQQTASGNETINQVWTKEHFDELNGLGQRKSYLKANLCLDLKPLKTSWASTNHYERDINGNEDEEDEDEGDFKHETQDTSPTPTTPDKEIVSPSHHARRPMNAFLIFCKKHRPIVRQKFPHLENRGVTRILGEWWALLETGEKSCYTNLAKEYKDAFFSANPDFKWYKLPAPPLRTLNTRPISVYKISSPLASPTHTTPTSAEFTPGKLADETQLGNLTSLMQTICPTTKTPDSHNTYASEAMDTNSFLNNNNNNNVDVENNSEKHKQLLITPSTDTITTSFPPKPIKKRKFYEFSESDNNNVAQDIFGIKSQAEVDYNENTFIKDTPDCDPNNGFHEPENMTQQELMNKVVDSMFPDKGAGMDEETKDETKETRKSGRSCKGRRYAEFMMEGKLLGTKQIKRFTQYKPDIINKFDNALSNKIEHLVHNKTETATPKLDLNETIKRLAERTNTKLEDIGETSDGAIVNKALKRKRTESENSDDTNLLKLQSDFNLHLRIAELPSLSYEAFMQRKKDSKKRKSIRSKSESSITKAKVTKLPKTENDCLVGSKKRKNKNNIIRLEPHDSYPNDVSSDLFGLATLAEVAANTQKIN